MKTRLLITCLSLCVAVTAQAAQLNLDQVAADARWVAHLDVDALWASQAGADLIQPLVETTHAQAELKKLRDATGFDLRKGLHGVTLYGREYKPRTGVVLISAEAKVAAITAFLAKQPDYQDKSCRGRTVYSWTDRHQGKKTVMACIYEKDEQSPLIVIAHRRAEMEKAIDVLDGKAARLSQADTPLAAEGKELVAGKPVIVTLGASGLAEVELPFRSPVVRQCERFNFVVGEAEGQGFVAARLIAKSEESAAEMGRVVEGLIAMGRLAGDTDEDMNKILDSVKLAVDGKAVILRWRGQVADVVRALARHAKEHKKKPHSPQS